MSLDVIAAMTLETGQPTFCPSDWSAALHWRPHYHSWWNNKISYKVKHIIKSYIRKCHQEVCYDVCDGWTCCIISVQILSLFKAVVSLLSLFHAALATSSCRHTWWKPDQRDYENQPGLWLTHFVPFSFLNKVDYFVLKLHCFFFTCDLKIWDLFSKKKKELVNNYSNWHGVCCRNSHAQ